MEQGSDPVSRRRVLSMSATGVALAGTGVGLAATQTAAGSPGSAAASAGAQGEEDDGTSDRPVETVVELDVLGVHLPATSIDGSLGSADAEAVAATVADELSGVEPADVRLRSDPAAVEVLADVAVADAAAALDAALDASVAPGYLRDRPTDATLDETAGNLADRLELLAEGAAESDGTAPEATVERVEAGRLRGEVRGDVADHVEDIVAGGDPRLVLHHPADGDGEYAREEIALAEHVQAVESATVVNGAPGVTVSLTEAGADRLADAMVEHGFTESEAYTKCSGADDPGAGEYCLLTVVDGEVVFSGGVQPDLGRQVDSGAFREERAFRLQTDSLETAQQLRLDLATRLRAPVEVVSVETRPVSAIDQLPGPGLAGALAALGVGAAVAARRALAADD